MSEQYILHLPVKEETYNLYMARYNELKQKNRKGTHDDLLKSLLGLA
jgi:hypothetical protein